MEMRQIIEQSAVYDLLANSRVWLHKILYWFSVIIKGNLGTKTKHETQLKFYKFMSVPALLYDFETYVLFTK